MKNLEELYPLSHKIVRAMGKAINDYGMIDEGDRLMIGLSGGKDSLVMSLALALILRKSPKKFRLFACLADQSNGGFQAAPVMDFMEKLEIETSVVRHASFEIIGIREERSPCSLCANFRRGILATKARELGCGKLVLGHHKDDAAETVILNMLYGGHFKCFLPNMYMTRSKLRVIRPMIYVEERSIALEAERLRLPVASSCCPYGNDTKRLTAKKILSGLETEFPDIKSSVIHALQNLKQNEAWGAPEKQ